MLIFTSSNYTIYIRSNIITLIIRVVHLWLSKAVGGGEKKCVRLNNSSFYDLVGI